LNQLGTGKHHNSLYYLGPPTTSGMITKHKISEDIINNKKIDFITIARIIVKNPRWIFQLAKRNKVTDYVPKQYRRII